MGLCGAGAGVITPVVFELLGKGHDLAADIGDARLCAILLGDELEDTDQAAF
ncbi:MAG: hypothetical protein ACLTBV_26725 [Enterocloster bolteae]